MSVVLASDFEVHDFERWVTALRASRSILPQIGAHQFVAYRSVDNPRRVFVTLGVRNRGPIDELLKSPIIQDWYDMAGLDDIPPLFVGNPVEKLRLRDDVESGDAPLPESSVVVASIARIDDFDRYTEVVHSLRDRMIVAGTRQHWTYRAVDDPTEVMTLEELDSLDHATNWTHNPDALNAFYAKAGIGIYPEIFVGRMLRIAKSADGAAL